MIGCVLSVKHGWTASDFRSLEKLWTYESSWSQYANNPRSDACGIPQAMNNCSFGYDPFFQISWGINYIAGRYHDSPAEALNHYYLVSWY